MGLAGSAPTFSSVAAAAEAGATPSPEQTASGSPQPTAAKTPDAEACKSVVAKVKEGNVGALETLTPERKQTLLANQGMRDAVICLAVASKDRGHCDVLDAEARKDCSDRWEFAQKLKENPKEVFKAELFYRLCKNGPTVPEGACEQAREAMKTRDTSVCQRLSSEASGRALCAGIISGDPAKCDTFKEARARAGCVAFVTGDPTKCEKDDNDCQRPLRSLAIISKEGLAGIVDIDPISAAVVKGKAACAALLEGLEKPCEIQLPAKGESASATPQPKQPAEKH